MQFPTVHHFWFRTIMLRICPGVWLILYTRGCIFHALLPRMVAKRERGDVKWSERKRRQGQVPSVQSSQAGLCLLPAAGMFKRGRIIMTLSCTWREGERERLRARLCCDLGGPDLISSIAIFSYLDSFLSSLNTVLHFPLAAPHSPPCYSLLLSFV